MQMKLSFFVRLGLAVSIPSIFAVEDSENDGHSLRGAGYKKSDHDERRKLQQGFGPISVVRINTGPSQLKAEASPSTRLMFDSPSGDDNHRFLLQEVPMVSSHSCDTCYYITHEARNERLSSPEGDNYSVVLRNNDDLMQLLLGEGTGGGRDVWRLTPATGGYTIHNQAISTGPSLDDGCISSFGINPPMPVTLGSTCFLLRIDVIPMEEVSSGFPSLNPSSTPSDVPSLGPSSFATTRMPTPSPTARPTTLLPTEAPTGLQQRFGPRSVVRIETRRSTSSLQYQLKAAQSPNSGMLWDTTTGDDSHEFVLYQLPEPTRTRNLCFNCYYIVHRTRNERLTSIEGDNSVLALHSNDDFVELLERGGSVRPGRDLWSLRPNGQGYLIQNQGVQGDLSGDTGCLYARSGTNPPLDAILGSTCFRLTLDVVPQPPTLAPTTVPTDSPTTPSEAPFARNTFTITNISNARVLYAAGPWSAGTRDPIGGDFSDVWIQSVVFPDGNYEFASHKTGEVLGCNEYNQIYTLPREYVNGFGASRTRWRLDARFCAQSRPCYRLICPEFNRALADGVKSREYGSDATVLQPLSSNLNQHWYIDFERV